MREAKLWQVTVHADDSDLPVVDLPVFAKTYKGALKGALKIIKSIEANTKKKCVCCDKNRLSDSVRCAEHDAVFGPDL